MSEMSANAATGRPPPGDALVVQSTNATKLTLSRNTATLTTGDVIGSLAFYTNDTSSNGTGEQAYVQAVSEVSTGNLTGLAFGTGGDNGVGLSEKLRITNAGNVGIG